MDCVKCSYREAMADSPFCEVCARGIDSILGPKHEADPFVPKHSQSGRRVVRSTTSPKRRPEGGFADRRIRERIGGALFDYLEQVPLIRPAEFRRIRPDIREIAVRYPFDNVAWYDSTTSIINLDGEALRALSSVLDCDPILLEHVVRLHAVFHKALHSYLGDSYDTIDDSLIEHYIHHMMFYLLVDPKNVQEMFPSLFQNLRKLSETEAYYRVFLAVHELQPEGCRVRDFDFASYPATWIIDSMSIVRRYRVKDFDEWTRFVFCRDDRNSNGNESRQLGEN